MTVKQRAQQAQHYNKGIVAAAVTVLAFVSGELGFEIPGEVQGALITLGVLIVPNR